MFLNFLKKLFTSSGRDRSAHINSIEILIARNQVLGAQVIISYDDNTSRNTKIPLNGVTNRPENYDCDPAAWLIDFHSGHFRVKLSSEENAQPEFQINGKTGRFISLDPISGNAAIAGNLQNWKTLIRTESDIATNLPQNSRISRNTPTLTVPDWMFKQIAADSSALTRIIITVSHDVPWAAVEKNARDRRNALSGTSQQTAAPARPQPRTLRSTPSSSFGLRPVRIASRAQTPTSSPQINRQDDQLENMIVAGMIIDDMKTPGPFEGPGMTVNNPPDSSTSIDTSGNSNSANSADPFDGPGISIDDIPNNTDFSDSSPSTDQGQNQSDPFGGAGTSADSSFSTGSGSTVTPDNGWMDAPVSDSSGSADNGWTSSGAYD